LDAYNRSPRWDIQKDNGEDMLFIFGLESLPNIHMITVPQDLIVIRDRFRESSYGGGQLDFRQAQPQEREYASALILKIVDRLFAHNFIQNTRISTAEVPNVIMNHIKKMRMNDAEKALFEQCTRFTQDQHAKNIGNLHLLGLVELTTVVAENSRNYPHFSRFLKILGKDLSSH
jgi:hypothetical protein